MSIENYKVFMYRNLTAYVLCTLRLFKPQAKGPKNYLQKTLLYSYKN